jgi:glyoxylase-like metal-dependent hydrolase (beta-lactamase superfamily II)
MASLPKEIAAGVYWLQVSIANIYFIRSGDSWSLVDTSIPNRGAQIRQAAEALFGAGATPQSIVLTHAHVDHSGSALELARAWRRPVHLSAGEMPFVDGKTFYPEPDPSVGGFMSWMIRVMPARTVDLEDAARSFNAGEALPGLPDWEVVSTPGHSPGHVSFFRSNDGTLIAGDAFATVNLDSLWDILRKRQEISRPPTPPTCNWPAARESVRTLAALNPSVLACGHGIPITGAGAAENLRKFSEHFPTPARGRYVNV